MVGSSGPSYTLCRPSRLLPTELALSNADWAFDAAFAMSDFADSMAALALPASFFALAASDLACVMSFFACAMAP